MRCPLRAKNRSEPEPSAISAVLLIADVSAMGRAQLPQAEGCYGWLECEVDKAPHFFGCADGHSRARRWTSAAMSDSCEGPAFGNTAFSDLLTELHAQVPRGTPRDSAKVGGGFTFKLQPEAKGHILCRG